MPLYAEIFGRPVEAQDTYNDADELLELVVHEARIVCFSLAKHLVFSNFSFLS